MPVFGEGWEIQFRRTEVQKKPTSANTFRTVGFYKVYHDGVAQSAPDLSGMFAETRGPGDNSKEGKGRQRIEEGRYPLYTQNGKKYKTIGYADSNMTNVLPRPGIELMETGDRTEILIHPASNFLWSIGCLNLCTNIPDGSVPITYTSSRRRVISVIDDLKLYLGGSFPTKNGLRLPDAWAVIEGEP